MCIFQIWCTCVSIVRANYLNIHVSAGCTGVRITKDVISPGSGTPMCHIQIIRYVLTHRNIFVIYLLFFTWHVSSWVSSVSIHFLAFLQWEFFIRFYHDVQWYMQNYIPDSTIQCVSCMCSGFAVVYGDTVRSMSYSYLHVYKVILNIGISKMMNTSMMVACISSHFYAVYVPCVMFL